MRISFDAGEVITLEEFRRRSETAYVKWTVEHSDSRTEAARTLGISRKNLWERLRKYGLGHLVPHPISEAEAVALRSALNSSPYDIAA